MDEENKNYNTENDKQERGLLGSVIGGLALGPVGALIGNKIQDMVTGDDKEKEEEQQKPQKKKGGSCSGNSSSDSSSSCNNPIGE